VREGAQIGSQNRRYRTREQVKKMTNRFGLAINQKEGTVGFRLTVDETTIFPVSALIAEHLVDVHKTCD
jgi:hypothetical protein